MMRLRARASARSRAEGADVSTSSSFATWPAPESRRRLVPRSGFLRSSGRCNGLPSSAALHPGGHGVVEAWPPSGLPQQANYTTDTVYEARRPWMLCRKIRMFGAIEDRFCLNGHVDIEGSCSVAFASANPFS